jgi:hypothetical protein
MEVHHHPDVHHKRKKIKEYFEVALNYYYLSASDKFDCIAAVRQNQLAIRLIELIKQEYHLDNE